MSTTTKIYRRVSESPRGEVGRDCADLARELGIPPSHIRAKLTRAAERESWRIAGMKSPTSGKIIWTYTGKARDHLGYRAEVHDGEGDVVHLTPDEVRAYVHLGIDERRGLDIPAEVRAEAMRPLGRSSGDTTNHKGAAEPTEEWTPSDPLIEAQANSSEIRRCAVCRTPIPSEMRADAEVCSPKHRRLLHRLRKGDPTVHEAIRMETMPPPCLGCGKPLAGRRAGTKYHGDYCRRLAAERRRGAGPSDDKGAEVSTGEWTPTAGVSAS